MFYFQVKIIRQPLPEEEDDSEDNLPPPPPPPGSPPPHLWPPRVKPINNIHSQIPTSIYPASPFPQTVLYRPAYPPTPPVPIVVQSPRHLPGKMCILDFLYFIINIFILFQCYRFNRLRYLNTSPPEDRRHRLCIRAHRLPSKCCHHNTFSHLVVYLRHRHIMDTDLRPRHSMAHPHTDILMNEFT